MDLSRSIKIWKIIVLLIVGLIAATILTLGFAKNQWGVVETQWFEGHQLDTESMVVGRLAKSQQDGIFSAGGLTGRAVQEGIDNVFYFQYLLYVKNLQIHDFVPYESQIGFQAIVFSFVDKLTNFTNYENLVLFKILTSALVGIELTIIIFWFYDQFGAFVGIVVFISTLLSQWLVVFGRNLWWVIWAFYLPMLISLGILYYEDRVGIGRYSYKTASVLLFVSVFTKCLFNGYEYITTTLIMMVTPFIYYGVRDKWGIVKLGYRTVAAMLSGFVGVLASMVILVFQISVVRGGLMFGLEHIIYSLGKRTYGSPDQYPTVYEASLKADTFSVAVKYLDGVWFDFGNALFTNSSELSQFSLELNYGKIIFLYLVFTGIAGGLLFDQIAEIKRYQNKLWALISVTWFSMLAPLSWFIIFKSHSFIHTHMNYITWHMPFTFFGFALIGYTIKLLGLDLKVRISGKWLRPNEASGVEP